MSTLVDGQETVEMASLGGSEHAVDRKALERGCGESFMGESGAKALTSQADRTAWEIARGSFAEREQARRDTKPWESRWGKKTEAWTCRAISVGRERKGSVDSVDGKETLGNKRWAS